MTKNRTNCVSDSWQDDNFVSFGKKSQILRNLSTWRCKTTLQCKIAKHKNNEHKVGKVSVWRPLGACVRTTEWVPSYWKGKWPSPGTAHKDPGPSSTGLDPGLIPLSSDQDGNPRTTPPPPTPLSSPKFLSDFTAIGPHCLLTRAYSGQPL